MRVSTVMTPTLAKHGLSNQHLMHMCDFTSINGDSLAFPYAVSMLVERVFSNILRYLSGGLSWIRGLIIVI